MNTSPLVSLDTLSRVRNELHARIAESAPEIALEPGPIGDALGWSLLFERWPDLLAASPVDRKIAFYNRYFWFKRFATLKQARDGYDAGLEQQVFRLLEQAEFEVDWSLLERLDAEAANSRG